MNRIIGNERGQEAVDWARKRMHLEGPTGKCLTWAMVDEQGEFVAAVVFSDITDHSACFHFAAVPGTRWMTRRFIGQALDLAFGRLNVKRLTGPIRGSNSRALAIAQKFGCPREGILRQAFPDGDDCHIYGLLLEEYRSHRWKLRPV